jgi:signal transduction histidine kinase
MDLSSMWTLKIANSVSFRRTLAFAAIFIASNLLLFAFIYWQTALYETGRITRFLEREAHAFAQASNEQITWNVQQRISSEMHSVTFSALFDQDGKVVEGNLQRVPPDLPIDGMGHQISMHRLGNDSGSSELVIAVAQRLPDGRLLVIGRNVQELGKLREIVARALKLGVIPMTFLGILAGALVSRRIDRRLKLAQQVLDHVKEGQLHQRLPVSKTGDELDMLAKGVNAMLGELERVMQELHHVGNNIAHDLRTPLSRVRAQLERAQRLSADQNDLEELINRAIAGLDQTFALTTSLLRIAEIETGRARASFGAVDLSEVIKEAVDLYEPLAEERRIAVSVNCETVAAVRGDRDLLLEALANLLDNAIKFTPDGGRIEVSLVSAALGPALQVRDTGPGIAAANRADVFKRFYRASQRRRVAGHGLGLSLVAAIVKLHGFSIEIKGGSPGCIFELSCFTNEPQGGPSIADSAEAPFFKRIMGFGRAPRRQRTART